MLMQESFRVLTLRTSDIDGEKMLIHVRSGKGRRERYSPPSKEGYEALRHFWNIYRPATKTGFPSLTSQELGQCLMMHSWAET